MSSSKIVDLVQLERQLDRLRRERRTIALANGGFDLLHVGHARYLNAAKESADFLVVAVNSDRALRSLKGEHRGYIDEKGRLHMIAALACVDYVILVDDTRMDDLITRIKPDFHCKGSDYRPEEVPEYETDRTVGTQLLIVGGPKVRSSSAIISRIAEHKPHA